MTEMYAEIEKVSQEIHDEARTLSDYIYDHPELGHQEFKSSQAHVDFLTRHGFQVEMPYLEMATAFRAVYDSGKSGLTVAFLVEYDALPVIGHGCGHNMLGTVESAAGVVVSRVIDQVGGRVIVFGTPAEETDGAKVDFAREGAFADVDFALCTHPSGVSEASGGAMAMEALEFEYFGKAAHAASSPWEGINALDAVINLFNSMNAMRQQLHESARVHGIIPHGGEACNVIPDYASAQFYIRAVDKHYLQEMKRRIVACAEAAALATGCRMSYHNFEQTYDNLITNQVLAETYGQHADELGVVMQPGDPTGGGSTDVGDVSQVVPTINSYFSISGERPLVFHTEEFREATRSPEAYQMMDTVIQILARTAVDVMTDPDLAQAMREEFQAAVN